MLCIAGDASVHIQRNAAGLFVISERSGRAFSAIDLGNGLFDLWSEGDCYERVVVPEVASSQSVIDSGDTADVVRAELPGLVSEVSVSPGDRVVKGGTIAIMEAMKLIHTVVAPRDVVIKKVLVSAGKTVAQRTILVEFEPMATEPPLTKAN